MKAVDVFTMFDGVANVVMAVAAVYAVYAWRKQIAGASQHSLAKRLSVALREIAIAREATVKNLRIVGSDNIDGQLARLFAPTWLGTNALRLEAAVGALRELESDVAVHWGDVMLNLVEVIRSESSLLADHAKAAAAPNVAGTMRGYLASWPTEPGIAPSFTGRAYGKALDAYAQLAQDWLGVHVGREGTKAMSVADLTVKRKQVDDEVGRLVEPEQASFQREREKWIAERGGPEELMRRIREEQAAFHDQSASMPAADPVGGTPT